MKKAQRRQVHGILLLDKPHGMSSNAALQRVKTLFYANKAGHTGSLDPLATGMLPICLGKATKLSQLLLTTDKQYWVTATLGVRTTTSDAEGDIVAQHPVPEFTAAQLEQVLQQFRGEIHQVPSMFSALKQQGVPLYQLARQGKEVPRAARPLTIYALQVLAYQGDQLQLQVHCSKGTYVRTLVDDIGQALGCGAHVSALRRLQVGPLHAAQMVSLDALYSVAEQGYAALDNTLWSLEQFQTILQDSAVLT